MISCDQEGLNEEKSSHEHKHAEMSSFMLSALSRTKISEVD